MKLVQALKQIPAIVRPTGYVHLSTIVTLISFFNANHSNFLNAFFMRPILNHNERFKVWD